MAPTFTTTTLACGLDAASIAAASTSASLVRRHTVQPLVGKLSVQRSRSIVALLLAFVWSWWNTCSVEQRSDGLASAVGRWAAGCSLAVAAAAAAVAEAAATLATAEANSKASATTGPRCGMVL